jgi:hypothetical protein
MLSEKEVAVVLPPYNAEKTLRQDTAAINKPVRPRPRRIEQTIWGLPRLDRLRFGGNRKAPPV